MLLKNKRNLIDLTKEFLSVKLKLNYVFCLWLFHLYSYPLQRIYKMALERCCTDKLQNKQKHKYRLLIFGYRQSYNTPALAHRLSYRTNPLIQVVCTTRCNIGSKESRTIYLMLKI